MYIASIMLLGSGELGREFTIAAKRLGCRVIACDRYKNAPAMQLADAYEVFPMLDGAALRAAVEKLLAVARAEQAAGAASVAEQLALHAQTEEEVLYPAAILVGEIIRARSRSK